MAISFPLKKMRFANNLAFILIAHFLVSLVIYFTLRHFNVINAIPNNSNVLSWDASWYYSIMKSGYKYLPYQTCNMAFFPLFPLVWKMIGTSAVWMSAINFLIFYFSIYLLLKREKLPAVFILLLLTLPSFIFIALPYSESIFFLFGMLIIRGHRDNSNLSKFLGFLGASLTRSVSLVFIPAIIISELIGSGTRSLKERLLSMLLSIFGCLLGLFSAAVLQYVQTGKWFYFLQIQKFWRREWIWPKLSLTTYHPERVLGVEAIAFSIGLVAIYFCAVWVFGIAKTHLYRQPKFSSIPESGVVFCALVISATLFLDTFFTYNIGESTNIWSLHRHLLCTPFSVMFLVWLYHSITTEFSLEITILSAILLLTVYLTDLYRFEALILYYCLFYVAFAALKVYPSSKLLYLLYPLGIVLQLQFLQDFLNGKWIA